MKGTKILAVAVAASMLGGCSSTSLNPFSDDRDYVVEQPNSNTTAVKDQTVNLSEGEGISIEYTLLGDLEKIEITGSVDSWKCANSANTCEIMAEADAKERLVKYLYQERVTSNRSVEVIAKTLDQARDDATNRIANGEQVESITNFERGEVEQAVAQDQAQGVQPSNTAKRVAETIETTKVSALTKITSQGTLRGLRKTRSGLINNGKTYVAVWEWSPKNQATASEIRNLMFSK